MGKDKPITPHPGEDRASYLKRWKTRQTELADHIKGMARRKQRTLDEWVPPAKSE